MRISECEFGNNSQAKLNRAAVRWLGLVLPLMVILVCGAWVGARWHNTDLAFRAIQEHAMPGMTRKEVNTLVREVGLTFDSEGGIHRRVALDRALTASFIYN